MFGENYQRHSYSFAATGIKMRDKIFSNRELAKEEMYKVMAKHNLTLQEVYDDVHCKTYICDKGVRFYINRAF